jgi:hypothetical protein
MERRVTGRHAAAAPFQWHTVDFQPAPYGWTIVCLDERGTVTTRPLPGWVVQEAVAYDSNGVSPEHEQPPRPLTRVIAAAHVEAELHAVYDAVPHFWRIDPPSTPKPTAGEITRELERRAAVERALATGDHTS